MPLPSASLAQICDRIRHHVDTLGQTPRPPDWDVNVTVGAPGANRAAANGSNTLNLFFYRFEPSGFHADARPGEVQWVRVFCVITAFGTDDDSSNDGHADASAGSNELRMLSQVMRLFQEQPVMRIEGEDAGEYWHVQFVPRPLQDEQINQIWSTQGDTVYRPSLVYEIALAPIKPRRRATEAAHVGAVGILASGQTAQRNRPWPSDRPLHSPEVPPLQIEPENPQWAPVLALVTGPPDDRQVHFFLHLEVPVIADEADFSALPAIDLWPVGGDGDLALVGQLLQNRDAGGKGGNWRDIDPVSGLTALGSRLDPENPPAPGTPGLFRLDPGHWTNLDRQSHSWQLQLFVERHIRFEPDRGEWIDLPSEAEGGMRIRSNPVLISVTREGP